MSIEIEEVSFENIHSLLSIDFGDTPEIYAEKPSVTIAYAYCGLLANMEGFCSAITLDGDVAGIILIGEGIPGENDPPACRRAGKFFRLIGFVIDAARRGQGIGKAALKKALNQFDSRYPGCPLILECHEQNTAAYRLYQSSNFEDTGCKTCGHHILIRTAP